MKYTTGGVWLPLTPQTPDGAAVGFNKFSRLARTRFSTSPAGIRFRIARVPQPRGSGRAVELIYDRLTIVPNITEDCMPGACVPKNA
jgi:hypothetical protein